MKRILRIQAFLWVAISLQAKAQLPVVSAGKIKRLENFPSKFVAARNVDVWLPDGYSTSKKYAVLYMQDGKSLFDSTLMWNRQEWGVDETITRLKKEKKINDCIVVAVWNSETGRHPDYFPQKPFDMLTPAQQEDVFNAKRSNGQPVFAVHQVQSNNYLEFLVTELKPFIDSAFSTLKDKANTFIAGSSMGGLISMYAICEYPQVFGGAACLSTHWPGIFTTARNPVPAAILRYLLTHLPSPKDHKIYFDHGTETLDSLYKPYQLQVDAIMKQRGYTAKNWMTKEFTGADHSENAWRRRFAIPATFLLRGR